MITIKIKTIFEQFLGVDTPKLPSCEYDGAFVAAKMVQ